MMKKILSDYVLFGIIIFLSAIQAVKSDVVLLTSSLMPGYVVFLQAYSNIMIIALMFVSIARKVFSTRLYFLKSQDVLVYFFVFQLLVMIFSKNQDFYIRFGGSVIIFLYFLLVVSKLTFFSDKGYNVIKSLMYGSAGVVLLDLYLYYSVPEAVLWQDRLYGVSAHANFTGVASSICFVAAVFMAYVNRSAVKRFIIPALIALCAAYVCVLSGSRTGIGGAGLAFAVFLFYVIRRREYRLLFVVLAVCTFLVLTLTTAIPFNEIMLGERGNTRKEVWVRLWDVASRLPLYGVGMSELRASENSYLYAVAAAGIIGAGFLFMAIIRLINNFLKYKNIKPGILVYRLLLILLLSEAMLEGFLVDTRSIPIMTFWTLLCFPAMCQNDCLVGKIPGINKVL